MSPPAKNLSINFMASRKLLIKPRGRQIALQSPELDGEWENGRRKGRGLLTKNKKLFEGSWRTPEERWWGRISQYNHDDRDFTLLYTGEIRGSRAEGLGYQHRSDGSYYEGQFLLGKRCGHGRCWYPDGSFYEGDWLEDVHNGKGLLVLPNGNRYEGDWKNGEKHGKGCFYHLDSGQLQKGLWKDGVAVTSTIEDLSYRDKDEAHNPTPSLIPVLELDPMAPCWVQLKEMEVNK